MLDRIVGTSGLTGPNFAALLKGMPVSQTVLDMYLAYAACKVASSSALWIGAYVGERELSERFVREVYLQKKPPPALYSVVTTTVIMHTVLMLACIGVITFTLFSRNHDALNIQSLAAWAALDMLLINTVTAITGVSIANNISNQTYFNYRVEGLRAVRALRRMLSWAFAPLALLPVSAMLVSKDRIVDFRKRVGQLAQAFAQF